MTKKEYKLLQQPERITWSIMKDKIRKYRELLEVYSNTLNIITSNSYNMRSELGSNVNYINRTYSVNALTHGSLSLENNHPLYEIFYNNNRNKVYNVMIKWIENEITNLKEQLKEYENS